MPLLSTLLHQSVCRPTLPVSRRCSTSELDLLATSRVARKFDHQCSFLFRCNHQWSSLHLSRPAPRPVQASQRGNVPKLESEGNNFWKNKTVARALLLLVPVLWGTYGPALRYIYEMPHPPSPSALTLARKVISLLALFYLKTLEESDDVSQKSVEGADEVKNSPPDFKLSTQIAVPVGIEWIAAGELGIWLFLGTALQADGLENTTATRAGFLMQTVTVLVPFISTFFGDDVNLATWIATILSLVAVILISVPVDLGNTSSNILGSLELSGGDIEMLLASFFYALCTVRLSKYAPKIQAVKLTANLMVVSTIFAVSWVLSDYLKSPFKATELDWVFSPNTMLIIAFSAVVPGTLASLGQTIGQKVIPPAEAQVYYSLTSFWSAIFATTILKENVESTTWIAGFLLLLAAIMASYDSYSQDGN